MQSGKPGGAEISTINLIKKLDRLQFNPIVLVPPDSLLFLELNKLGVETIGLTLPKIKSSNPLRLIRSLFEFSTVCLKIRHIIRQKQVKVVHSVSNKRSAVFSIVSARLAKTPVVWTIRVLDRVKFIDYLLLSWANKLVAISDTVKNYYDQNHHYDRKFVRIYNAVDLQEFDLNYCSDKSLRKKWDLKPKDFVVAIVSRFSPEKGHEYFIRAAAKILKLKPQIKFVAIGDPNFYGDDTYYKSLIELCKRLNVANKIKFVGFDKDIPRFMSSIDVLTLCCDNDSFGRVVIEGMAMEKPVISFNAGGPREIIEHGKTGLLIPSNDVDALAESILHLYRNHEMRIQMGKLGRQRVVENFSIEKHVAAYEQVYRELVVWPSKEK